MKSNEVVCDIDNIESKNKGIIYHNKSSTICYLLSLIIYPFQDILLIKVKLK
jgi:hypothetical protein